MKPIRLTFSLADQNFQKTKSLGIYNLSISALKSIALRPEFAKVTALLNPGLEQGFVFPPNIEKKVFPSPAESRLGRVWWDQIRVYSEAKKTGNEWLFLPKGFASFLRPCPVLLATCVADGMIDYYQKRYPQAVSRFELAYFDLSLRATIRQSKVVFTISDFSTAEVLRLAAEKGLQPPLVRTMGIGFERSEPGRVEARRNRLVVLTGKFPHKRSDLAIDFLRRSHEKGLEPEAVDFVGSLPDGLAIPQIPGWRWHPRLAENEYRQLISESKALVYFSEYEGFGMPPVEAALAGSVPVFSDIPVTREVMGETGLSFQNDSWESFDRALRQSFTVSPETIGAWREILLDRHSWQKVADRIVRGIGDSQGVPTKDLLKTRT